jgi:hypothetical protein
VGNVARPMLAEVLAALTELPADVWDVALAERSPGWHARPVLGSAQVRFHLEVGGAAVDAGPRATWTVTDPADAQETLVARGLLPEGWCGDVRRAWWCAACEGDGYRKPTDDTDTDPYTGGGIWRPSACWTPTRSTPGTSPPTSAISWRCSRPPRPPRSRRPH